MIIQVDGHFVLADITELPVYYTEENIIDYYALCVPEVNKVLNGYPVIDYVYVNDVLLNLITVPTLKILYRGFGYESSRD